MERILILIASYRDADLMSTIESAISQAKYPDRLVFAVCYQEKKGEEYEKLLQIPSCRVIQVDPEDSEGVCWARSLTQTLWQGEEYILQTDSNMRFAADWDVLSIYWHAQCPGKAILTACCPFYYPGESMEGRCAWTMGAEDFDIYGMLRFQERRPIWTDSSVNVFERSRTLMGMVSRKPLPGAFWSAHFSFSSGDVISELPYDPELYSYGEEISYAVRAYTHGYHLYYPPVPLCFRRSEQDNGPKHWNDHEVTLQNARSAQKVRRLLGMEPSKEKFGKFGLGTVRTLAEYEAFSDVNFQKRTFGARAFLGDFGALIPAGNPSFPGRRFFASEAVCQKQKVLAVTAFRDIGRGKWLRCQRSTELYLEWFSMLCKLKHLNLVCYCDESFQKELPSGDYKVRPFAEEQTFWGKYIDRARQIAKDPVFRNAIGKRKVYPEHRCPEYAMLTHCKASFLKRAKEQFPDVTHYIWIDFGCCRIPIEEDALFDWSPWMDDKIHFQALCNPQGYPKDRFSLCIQSPDVIAAAVIIVPRELIDWYLPVYEEELKAMLEEGILDDEQNVMLQLARRFPEYITMERVPGWYSLLYEAIGY